MISVEHLSIEFSAKPLFTDVSFVVNDRDRIALTGKNGAGKSTLLKVMAGQQMPTSGTVASPRGTTIGYLPQVMELAGDRSVVDEALLAFGHIHELQADIERMQAEMAERTDYESEAYMALVERYTHAEERFRLLGGLNFRAEVERTLTGLGFVRSDFDRPTCELSGGWRMRIELAKLLLRQPDVLLLDEPTNHLDIESIQWLEQYLQQRPGAVILVSHDRAFINNVTTRTLEISCGRIWDYKVRYDEYVRLRAERREQQLRAYENQQREIADLKDFIERFRYKPTKAVQVQERIKQLARIVPIEVDEVDNSSLHLKFPPCQRSGDFPLIVEDLAKSYGSERYVVQHVNLTIRRGEKVAFVGRNGEGKSTLVKCILGEIPFEGSLKVGHNAQIGYFAQNQAQLLDPELTVFDTIDRVARGDIRSRIRDILGAFMFGGEEADKKVKVLSGGERSRLAMIKLLLEPVNFLILDEPTNHLDMRSKDVLKEAIAAFDGTVILVSHDRQFLDGLVSKVYSFAGGRVREHLGGIYDWLRHSSPYLQGSGREASQGGALHNVAGRAAQSTPSASHSSPIPHNEGKGAGSAGASSYAEQKAAARERRKLERAVAESEQELAELEAAKSILEAKMSTPEGAADASLFERHARLRQQIEDVEARWLEASEALTQ
ncbi:MAG: ABC-F family ATP-binding cassette domain-containing protein [Bacteroidaceae bacterium]|nr:ABC-F family ATP-binding cassette domain-containing protein [Bacteroidaceae bacterium]